MQHAMAHAHNLLHQASAIPQNHRSLGRQNPHGALVRRISRGHREGVARTKGASDLLSIHLAAGDTPVAKWILERNRAP